MFTSKGETLWFCRWRILSLLLFFLCWCWPAQNIPYKLYHPMLITLTFLVITKPTTCFACPTFNSCFVAQNMGKPYELQRLVIAHIFTRPPYFVLFLNNYMYKSQLCGLQSGDAVIHSQNDSPFCEFMTHSYQEILILSHPSLLTQSS